MGLTAALGLFSAALMLARLPSAAPSASADDAALDLLLIDAAEINAEHE
jgi:hypothetical protein